MTDQVHDYMTAVNWLVRRTCREVLGVVPGYFKPARQRRPAGTTAYDFATVNITSSDLVSVNVSRFGVTDPLVYGYVPAYATDLVELVDPLDQFTASINFYRSGQTDVAGIAVAVAQTMGRARTLVKLLESSAAAERMRAYGLGYITASKCRDLSAMVDGNFEDRTQVDLDFYVSDPVVIAINAIAEVDITTKFQSQAGLITAQAEVSS
jgi:hypothetical protein